MTGKLLGFISVIVLVFVFVSCSSTSSVASSDALYRVAMITDSGNITDRGFNQATYEACRDFCGTYIPFKFFMPAGDSTPDRVAMIKAAADEGYNVIVMPGYVFGDAIKETAPLYPKVYFIAVDVSQENLGKEIPKNVFSMVFNEEIAGFFAGYAAVKMGYRNLGFLGGSQVPAVIRYGYGFVQGAELAAEETDADVKIRYLYANTYYGSATVTNAMSSWYREGTECVFSCGGGLFTSVAEAASKNGGKIIGVDVDQAETIDDAYGRGITVTSSVKGLYASVQTALRSLIENGVWNRISGTVATMGIVSENPDKNYVGIPSGSGTQFCDSFTLEDYKSLIKRILHDEVTVSSDYEKISDKIQWKIDFIHEGNLD